MRITDITEAIFQKYQGSVSLKQTLPGGFYYQQAPQRQAFPYCVFYINGITQDEVMGVKDCNIYTVEIQFNLFTAALDDGDDIALLLDKTTKAFDWSDVNVSGWHLIGMQRDAVEPILFVDEIWQATINYELMIQKEN